MNNIHVNARKCKCVVPESVHTPPTEGHWKYLGGGGVFKSQNLEEKYEAKLKFPGGECLGGAKKPFCGEYGYFLELHNKKHIAGAKQ